jgi:hypothetical protein
MLDPLSNFDWDALHQRYDSACLKGSLFERNAAEYLAFFQPRPSSDRMLYYSLIDQFALRSSSPGITLGCYEAMLYWKLYSQPAAVANVCRRLKQDAGLREVTSRELASISRSLPSKLSKDPDDIVRVLTGLTKYLHGMASSCAIPVRTTLLHFAYPEVVPIFDKQVLLAVGVSDKEANHSHEFLREYIPHAWSLADRYRSRFSVFEKETAVRVVDMALWLSRGR